MLNRAEIDSPLGQKMQRLLREQEQQLLKRVGAAIDPDPAKDAIETARLRGRIAEVRMWMKRFEAGATAPVESGDESPQL